MPYSLYRPVGPCSSGLARPRLTAPASNITSSSFHPPHQIYPSYSRILVSFIYIAYIIFIIYIYRRDMMSHATISKQAPAAPPPVPSAKSNERHETKNDSTWDKKQTTTSQMGDAAHPLPPG